MGDRTFRGEPGHSESKRQAGGRLVELSEAPAPARVLDRARPPGRAEIQVDVEFSDRFGDEEKFQRVGGRRRFRPEILLVVAGSLFLALALLKPWPSGAAPRASSATPTGDQTQAIPDTVAQVATPVPTVLQSPIGWPDVPPWDYGWPVAGSGQPTPLPGNAGPGAGQVWRRVDWTALGTQDPHDGWGYAIAMMPDPAQLPASAPVSSPSSSWVTLGSVRFADVKVDRGSQVYALAVTWPHSLSVTSVTVEFIGGPGHPANLPPAGFPAYAEVSPLPAAQVSSSEPAAPSTSYAPAIQPPTPTTFQAAGASSVLSSGQFWIPPAAGGSGSGQGSIAEAWRSQPWPWPDGTYAFTITATTGVTRYLLTLEAA
jgi:hypothetical protein